MKTEVQFLREALVKIERLTDEERSPLIDRIRSEAAKGLVYARAAKQEADGKVTI